MHNFHESDREDNEEMFYFFLLAHIHMHTTHIMSPEKQHLLVPNQKENARQFIRCMSSICGCEKSIHLNRYYESQREQRTDKIKSKIWGWKRKMEQEWNYTSAILQRKPYLTITECANYHLCLVAPRNANVVASGFQMIEPKVYKIQQFIEINIPTIPLNLCILITYVIKVILNKRCIVCFSAILSINFSFASVPPIVSYSTSQVSGPGKLNATH